MCNGDCNCKETGPQEAQRLTREATKSRPSPLGKPVSEENNGEPQPGTEDVPV